MTKNDVLKAVENGSVAIDNLHCARKAEATGINVKFLLHLVRRRIAPFRVLYQEDIGYGQRIVLTLYHDSKQYRLAFIEDRNEGVKVISAFEYHPDWYDGNKTDYAREYANSHSYRQNNDRSAVEVVYDFE